MDNVVVSPYTHHCCSDLKMLLFHKTDRACGCGIVGKRKTKNTVAEWQMRILNFVIVYVPFDSREA